MERPSHPTPKGIARGEQRLRRIQSMVDEGVVQKLGRARVHTTKRVEGKRNEAKLVLVADLLVRLDVVVVEQLVEVLVPLAPVGLLTHQKGHHVS